MKFKMQSYPKKGRGIMKKGYIILLVILLSVLFVFIPTGLADPTNESMCGDGQCYEKTENCCNCPADCGCGDGLCLSDEGGCWCGYCGDGQCTVYAFKPGSYEKSENCHNCPADCGCSDGLTCLSDEGGCWMCGCIDGVMVLDEEGHVICRPKKDDVNGGAAVCGNGVCETDKGESCANCLSDCSCSSGEACQPSDSNADAFGCVVVVVAPNGMALTVSTNKNAYSPEETVIVSGSVRDAKSGGPISGANVVIDINPKVSATTDSSGNYKKNVTLPSDISQGKHTVTVTASKTGYPDVSKTTSFNVGGEFKVSLETDKENYAVGDVIKINGVVTSPDPIGSDLELNLEIRIYDSSGSVYRIQRTFIHSDGSYNEQIKIFGNDKPGPWGQGGKPGKWRIEAIALKEGYPDAEIKKLIWVGKEMDLTVKLDPEKSSEDASIKKFNHFNTFYPTENILVTGEVRDVESSRLLNKINIFINGMNQKKEDVSANGGSYGIRVSNEGQFNIYTIKISIPENTPPGTYTVKVTASGVADNKVGYAEKTITENFEVKEDRTIREFIDYLKKLEAKNPDKTRTQLIAYLHADSHPGDVNGELWGKRFFQHGPETDGYGGVKPVERVPKWIVDDKRMRIDISHSYAALRSDSNRRWYESTNLMRYINTLGGDYWQVAKKDYGSSPLAAFDVLFGLSEKEKRVMFGGRGAAPTNQLLGDDIGILLAEYYMEKSNKEKPLSEAYGVCLGEYPTLKNVKKTRTNPHAAP